MHLPKTLRDAPICHRERPVLTEADADGRLWVSGNFGQSQCVLSEQYINNARRELSVRRAPRSEVGVCRFPMFGVICTTQNLDNF